MAGDTRERMIETTARLLQHRGYYGTPLSAILAESDAPRGSLYFHFPGGKDELVLEATRRSAAEATAALRACLAAGADPAAAVRALFEGAAEVMEKSRFTYGCPVAPVILDAVPDLDELQAICRATFEQWVGMLVGAFRAAGLPNERAGTLALLVETSLEGLLLFARAWRDVAPMRTIGAELETLIGTAIRDAQVNQGAKGGAARGDAGWKKYRPERPRGRAKP